MFPWYLQKVARLLLRRDARRCIGHVCIRDSIETSEAAETSETTGRTATGALKRRRRRTDMLEEQR